MHIGEDKEAPRHRYQRISQPCDDGHVELAGKGRGGGFGPDGDQGPDHGDEGQGVEPLAVEVLIFQHADHNDRGDSAHACGSPEHGLHGYTFKEIGRASCRERV